MEHKFSPHDIVVLIAFYATTPEEETHEQFYRTHSRAAAMSYSKLKSLKLIEITFPDAAVTVTNKASTYKITELGKAFIALIMCTPIPEICSQYKDPRTDEIIPWRN